MNKRAVTNEGSEKQPHNPISPAIQPEVVRRDADRRSHSMALILAIAAALLVALQSFSVLPALADDSTLVPTAQFIKGEVIVELKPGASIDIVNSRNRTETRQRLYGTNLYKLRTPHDRRERKWQKRLASDPDVLSAALNPVVASPGLFGRSTTSFPDGFATPGLTQADFSAQTGLFSLLQLDEVGKRSNGKGVVVAIVDTGIDRTHPLLAGRLWRDNREDAETEGDDPEHDNDHDGLKNDWRGWDFIGNNNDPTEKWDDPGKTVAGHGTFIAGLIALLAPNAQIMPVRVFPADGVTDSFTVAAGVKYAADHGARVINLSLGSSEKSDLLQGAIEDARQRGIIIVAAVGNDGTETSPQFPSTMNDVMAVAAIDLDSHLAGFSNFGTHVDVCAPGSKLVGPFPSESKADYARWSGTSFAAPLAAAEAALVLSADPDNPDAKKVVEDSAININIWNQGFEGKIGRGRINPLGALKSLNDSTSSRIPADFHSSITFTRGVAGGDSFGGATATITSGKQEFLVEAYRLSVQSTYKLLVDGIQVGAAYSASLGSVKFYFSNDPANFTLVTPLNPVTRIRHVELRDLGDRVALQGTFGAIDATPVTGAIQKEARLLTTGVLSNIGGTAIARVEGLLGGGRRETLILVADGLSNTGSYRFIVDGVIIGTDALRSDYLKLILTSDGSDGFLLPPALRPVTDIKRVVLIDARGQTILQGDFANIAAVNQAGQK
jgi:subtilase family protein